MSNIEAIIKRKYDLGNPFNFEPVNCIGYVIKQLGYQEQEVNADTEEDYKKLREDFLVETSSREEADVVALEHRYEGKLKSVLHIALVDKDDPEYVFHRKNYGYPWARETLEDAILRRRKQYKNSEMVYLRTRTENEGIREPKIVFEAAKNKIEREVEAARDNYPLTPKAKAEQQAEFAALDAMPPEAYFSFWSPYAQLEAKIYHAPLKQKYTKSWNEDVSESFVETMLDKTGAVLRDGITIPDVKRAIERYDEGFFEETYLRRAELQKVVKFSETSQAQEEGGGIVFKGRKFFGEVFQRGRKDS